MAPIPFGMEPEELAILQSQTSTVGQEIKRHHDLLRDEYGNYQLQTLETGRVLLIPEGTTVEEEWLVCYMSDATPSAVLVLDDYVPELTEQTGEEVPVEGPSFTTEDAG